MVDASYSPPHWPSIAGGGGGRARRGRVSAPRSDSYGQQHHNKAWMALQAGGHGLGVLRGAHDHKAAPGYGGSSAAIPTPGEVRIDSWCCLLRAARDPFGTKRTLEIPWGELLQEGAVAVGAEQPPHDGVRVWCVAVVV